MTTPPANEMRCPTCDARFVDGHLIWATGNPGKLVDLAGLVCNKLCGDRVCINPCLGNETGETWEARAKMINIAIPPTKVSSFSSPSESYPKA